MSAISRSQPRGNTHYFEPKRSCLFVRVFKAAVIGLFWVASYFSYAAAAAVAIASGSVWKGFIAGVVVIKAISLTANLLSKILNISQI